MIYEPDIHHRRSIRLRDYDYAAAGAYFVTVCTQGRECLFGTVADGEMRLNDFGQIVHEEWIQTGRLRTNVEMDMFVVMPNHFHGILMLHEDGVGATRRVARDGRRTQDRAIQRIAPTTHAGLVGGSLGAIVGQFKSIMLAESRVARDSPRRKTLQDTAEMKNTLASEIS